MGMLSLAELRGVLADVVDRAGQEEGLLGQRVGLALEDLLERGDRVLDRDVLAGAAGEDLGDEERLAHEPLQTARPGDRSPCPPRTARRCRGSR
jgi:hypothetical protein